MPTIEVAVCDALASAASALDLAISSRDSTIVNCAVWAMYSVPSVGDSGFWKRSWATSSLRNVSLPNCDDVGSSVGVA